MGDLKGQILKKYFLFDITIKYSTLAGHYEVAN
jgi:hypothetical protein